MPLQSATSYPLKREQIVQALVEAVRPLDYVNAVWEGGAVAFGRADEWSDIDMVIDAADDRADDVWFVLEPAIRKLGEIEFRFDVPNPPLGLRSQRFYRLRDAGPYLLLDIDVFGAATKDKMLDSAIHGNAVVHFDRTGVARVQPSTPTDRAAGLASRLATLRVTVPLFQALVMKEVHRGNAIEAVAFYHAWAVRPLVELLRIQYAPSRYQFHTRYVYHDLPPKVVDRLTPFFFLRDLPELAKRRQEAEEWATELLAELADDGNKQT